MNVSWLCRCLHNKSVPKKGNFGYLNDLLNMLMLRTVDCCNIPNLKDSAFFLFFLYIKSVCSYAHDGFFFRASRYIPNPMYKKSINDNINSRAAASAIRGRIIYRTNLIHKKTLKPNLKNIISLSFD